MFFFQTTMTATQKNHYLNDILLNFVGSEYISKGRETHDGKQLYFYVSGFALNLCVSTSRQHITYYIMICG